MLLTRGYKTMNRLTTSLLLLVLLTTIGLGWLFDRGFEEFGTGSVDHLVDKVRVFEMLGMAISGTANNFDSVEAFKQSWPSSEQASGIDLDLQSLSDLSIPAQLQKQLLDGQPLVLESEQHMAFHFYLRNHQSVLILTAPYAYFVTHQQSGNFVITLLFYLALILLIAMWLVPLVRQLQRLRITAKAFGRGELEQRIVTNKLSYIADIESEFNQMAQRIEDLVSDVKLLGSAVSHDLRTPLSKLRFGLDTLQEETDPQRREVYFQKLNDNLDQMGELIEVLLNYARMDQAQLALKFMPLELEKFLSKAIERVDKSSIKISLQAPQDAIIINADKGYMKMMIDNLLGNAVRHARSEVKVKLLLSAKNTVQLTIEDDGEGVPDSVRENCFKPFVRGENSAIAAGHGMGLAIVKRVCQWHHGTIRLLPKTEKGGACFVVALPL